MQRDADFRTPLFAAALVSTLVLLTAQHTPAQSCDGHCGGYAGPCWCDSLCTQYGDCCADFAAQCPDVPVSVPPFGGGSCDGHCGGNAGTCWCDSVCTQYGDCCPDFQGACSQLIVEPPTPPVPASCEGHCGASAGTCWCDSLCTQYGDCCPDFQVLCAQTVAPPPPAPQGSCEGNCGGSASACWCDSLCALFADCCADFAAACSNVLPSPPAVVSLPTDATIGSKGSTTSVDLSFDVTNAGRIFSGYLDIRYDPAIVQATAVDKAALPDDCLFVPNLVPVGQIRVAFACVSNLTHNGALFSITFEGQSDGSSVLHIEECMLNEGDPACAATDGSLVVSSSGVPLADSFS